jgi:hypothetical protein
MKSNTKTFRSFRFWTILVPLIMTIASLTASSALWIHLDGGTDDFPFWGLVGYSAFCSFITACSALLHFYGNAWVDSYGHGWIGDSYFNKATRLSLVTERLDWRLIQSVNNVAIVILCASPIGLFINVIGIGIAIIRAAALILIKTCEFLWSCRPGTEGVEQG